MKIRIINTGYARAFEKVILEGGDLKPVQMPVMAAILEHPTHGLILFDTGYSQRIWDATRKFPERLYRLAVPSKVDVPVKQQLDRMQINCRDVNYVIVSHFHADHVCGLKDFPNAKFICSSASYDYLDTIESRWEAARKAIFKSLLPKNMDSRIWLYDLDKSIPIQKDRYLGSLHDLFGDQSILLTDLSGHATGQTGAMINTDEDTYLLIADACWTSESFKQNIMPSPAAKLIFEDWDRTEITLKKIHQYFKANPTTHIIPSHCPQAVPHYIRKTQQQRFTASV